MSKGIIKLSAKQFYFPEHPFNKGHYFEDYNAFWQKFLSKSNTEEKQILLRDQFRRDLFFLLYYGFNRKDTNKYSNRFIINACIEVQDGPDTDTLDLWSRGHYKSSIITQAKTLQDIFKDKERSIGIFSHTRPIAKDFLFPIKVALETNAFLKFAFPDIIWQNPQKEAPVWSMDVGLELNRKTTSNTHSLEASGLVDGMPTAKHYDIRVYDDVITDKVTSVDMMNKAAQQFRLSNNLSSDGGWERVIGTNYSHGDFYQQRVIEAEKGVYPWHVRTKPWFSDEEMSDREMVDAPAEYVLHWGYKKPALLTPAQILEKWKKQSDYIFACQMELNPTNEANAEFKLSWLKRFRKLPENRAKFILVDPANEKKPESDYTAMVCISIDDLGNKYWEDGVRDKLDLGERWDALLKMYNANRPIAGGVFYEKYGKDSDIWYFEQRQLGSGRYFTIEPMAGPTRKLDRIRRLVPICKQGQFYVPENGIWYLGKDLVQAFINEEYVPFPYCQKFDLIDAISRIEDPNVMATGPPVQNLEGVSLLTQLNEQHANQRAIEGL